MNVNHTSEAMLAIDETTLQAVRTRRSGGESLKTLAAEVGLTWQRLWGLQGATLKRYHAWGCVASIRQVPAPPTETAG